MRPSSRPVTFSREPPAPMRAPGRTPEAAPDAGGSILLEAAQMQGLPSEQLVRQGQFPPLLNTRDLTIIAATLILYVTNISVVTFAGAAALPYWIFGFVTFFIPSALVTSKLARMFPGEGAFYVWVHKALGPFWDSLLGFFCLWWPPVLLIIAAGAAVAGFLQSIGASFGRAWLVAPWQQGIVVLCVLALTWFIAQLPLSDGMRLIRGVFYVYLGILGLMALVTLIWLLFPQHVPQTDFHAAQFQINGSNVTFYSTVILACLGIQLPLNLGGEVREQPALWRYLSRSVLIVMGGYLLVWFALAVVLPQDPTNPLSAGNPGNIGQVFALALGSGIGQILSTLASLSLAAFYVVSSGAYCLVQSRLVVMAALDRRLPVALGQVDARGVPRAANLMQIGILVPFTLGIFFLAPALSPQGANFETIIYTLISASAVVLWAISALGLFLVGAILVLRYRKQAEDSGGAPVALIVVCACIGSLATIACLWLVFTGPWIPLLSQADWFFWVALLVLASLAVGSVYSFLAPEPEDVWAFLKRTKHIQGVP